MYDLTKFNLIILEHTQLIFLPRTTMAGNSKGLYMICLKKFANKINLTRHIKNIHRSHVQAPVDKFNIPRQSGLLHGAVSGDKVVHRESGTASVDEFDVPR